MTFAIHLLNGVQILNTELDPSKCNKYYIKICENSFGTETNTYCSQLLYGFLLCVNI